MSKKDRLKGLIFEKPSSRSGDDERETYYLAGPEDFSEYMVRIEDGSASEAERDEFDLRIIDRFCEQVFNDEPIDRAVQLHLADQMYKVIMGGRWEDELPLPWTKQSIPFTRAEWQGHGIFCDVANTLKASPEKAVTDVIKGVADDWAVSYETARLAYYSMKKRTGM